MARTWLRIRVDLVGGRGIACDSSPGRIFLVGPSHSFEQFAEAIDGAFGRWTCRTCTSSSCVMAG